MLDQRQVRADPVTGQPRQIVERLDDIGLALTIAADKCRDTGLEGDLQIPPRPEVVQRKVRGVQLLWLIWCLWVDRVATKLVAHRCDRLHRRAVILSRGEAGK